jgi:PAS domain S-box-containing protein
MGTIRHQHQDSREVSAMATSLPAWLYQHIIAHTQDAIIFADGEGIIRLWNAGAETLFGYSAAEALGHSLDLIIPAPLRARHWEGYQRVMAPVPPPMLGSSSRCRASGKTARAFPWNLRWSLSKRRRGRWPGSRPCCAM